MNIADLKRRIVENRKSGLIGAAIATCVGLLLLITPLGEGLKHISYDLPYEFRSQVVPDDAIIVYMDDKSLLGLKQYDSLTWNRSLHAKLLEKMQRYRAQAVVFDLAFDTDSTNKLADTQLAQAIQNTPKVVLGSIPHQKPKKPTDTFGVTPPYQPFRKKAAHDLDNWGLVELLPESDKVIRRHFHSDDFRTSLSWRAAEMILENPPENHWLNRWINYYGPARSLDKVSYVDVDRDDGALASKFEGKTVFVGSDISMGAAIGRVSDTFDIPFTRWEGGPAPGVEIHATCFLNLVHKDWLTELSPFTELAYFIVSGFGFGFVLVLFRPVPATVIGVIGIGMVSAAGLLLFLHGRVLSSWFIVASVQIPFALAWSVIAYSVRLQQEKTLLETVVRTSRGTGLPAPVVAQASPSAADAATIVPGKGPQTPGAQPGAPQTEPAISIPDHDLVRCVGRGAYGEVWLARDILGNYKAVKVIYKKTFQNDGPFEREFKGIQRFTPISRNHPGWVQILHVGRPQKQDYFYYIMELGDDENSGQTVDPATYCAKNLARELDKRGKLPVQECLELALSLSSALQYLHSQNLIHRDIKPSNIIFVRDQPKFADIGLVTEVGGTNRDVTYVGTQGYIPPEGPGKPQADVFSLGKVIYETSMGRDRDQFPELPTTLVERPDREDLLQLNEVILKACEYDVERRFQTAQELYDALLKVQFDTRHLKKQ